MPGEDLPAAEERDPRLEESLEALLASETAGDPMGRHPMAKSSSLRHRSAALKKKGHAASPPTVSKLLRKLKYSPKVNARRTEVRGASAAQHHEQIAHINEQREDVHTAGDRSISVDTEERNDRRLQECRQSVAQGGGACAGT
jgi:hypothetical protein